MKDNIYIFGAGPIGCEYYNIFTLLGYKPLLLTNSIETKDKLSNNFNIERFADLKKRIFNSTVIIALPTMVYPKVLKDFNIQESNLFIEKPAIYNLNDYKNIEYLSKSNYVGVCLNRRFYKSLKYILDYNKKSKPLRILIDYHERINFLPKKFSQFDKENWIKQNGIHVFDYIELLFGNLSIKNIRNETGNKSFFTSIGDFGNIPYYLNASFDSFSSFKIEIQYNDSSIHLNPIEKLIHKSKSGSKTIEEDNKHKPGFESMVINISKGNLDYFANLKNILELQKKLQRYENARL